MIFEFGLFFTGILGFIILYVVLAHLSARMGEGMGLPKYYLLYYIAIVALILTLPAGWSNYAGSGNSKDTLFMLLTAGNAVVLAASFKYWWWLKSELVDK